MRQPIQLPQTRHRQLRSLADRWDCTIAEAIERLLDRAVADGDLEDSLPGFTARPIGGKVEIAFDCAVFPGQRSDLPHWHLPHAREIAGHIERAASESGRVAALKIGDPFGGPDSLIVARQGRGITLVHKRGDIEFAQATLTKSMGCQFARQIRSAAQGVK